MSNYINLHAHTHYSPMDGYSTVDEYMERAKEIGMPALAITDHGTSAGHRDFQRQTKAAGIKPILGIEAYLSPTDRWDRRTKANREEADSVYNHLILLAKDNVGLNNLHAGNRVAWGEGFYQKPRWDFELLEEHSSGLVVLSGCLNGVMAKAIDRGDPEAAYDWARKFYNVFGEDFYVEIQTHNPEKINSGLLKIADDLGIKPVITDDCHHASPKDKVMQEIFLILSTHPKQDRTADIEKAQKMSLMERFDYLYPDRKMTFKDFDLYLEAYQEKRAKMQKLGLDREDIYSNTVEVAEKVGTYNYFEGLKTLPDIAEDPSEVIRLNVQRGLKAKGLDQDPEYQARAKRELGVITEKQFSNYFLVVEDMLRWAKKNQIRIGKGRGSAAGSLVCYALGITGIDPIKNNLLFERFLDGPSYVWDPEFPELENDKKENT
jgi:DNA polymerase-3 subunit alpha